MASYAILFHKTLLFIIMTGLQIQIPWNICDNPILFKQAGGMFVNILYKGRTKYLPLFLSVSASSSPQTLLYCIVWNNWQLGTEPSHDVLQVFYWISRVLFYPLILLLINYSLQWPKWEVARSICSFVFWEYLSDSSGLR